MTAAAGVGIGGSIARRLHADGAHVIFSDAAEYVTGETVTIAGGTFYRN